MTLYEKLNSPKGSRGNRKHLESWAKATYISFALHVGSSVFKNNQTCQVSHIWSEVHTFLAHSCIHAAFLKSIFTHFLPSVPTLIQKYAQIYLQLLTFRFVFPFQVMFCSTSLTESRTNSWAMSRQIVRNTKHNFRIEYGLFPVRNWEGELQPWGKVHAFSLSKLGWSE